MDHALVAAAQQRRHAGARQVVGMDVVGVHVVLRSAAPACRAAARSRGWPPVAVERVDAGDAQDRHAHAGTRGHTRAAALRRRRAGARGRWPDAARASRRTARAGAVAVHAAGAGVDEAPHAAAARQRRQQAAVRGSCSPWPAAAPGAAPRRPGRARRRQRGRRRPGCPAAARRRRRAAAPRRCGESVSASTRQRPRSSRSTRRPTSPQPTISRRGLRSRRVVRAAWEGTVDGRPRSGLRAQCGSASVEVAQSRSTRCAHDELMSMQVTVQPAKRSFRGRTRRADPGRRHPPGHRPALRLPDGACGSCKSRLLEGRVIHGAHQLKALSRGRGRRRAAC